MCTQKQHHCGETQTVEFDEAGQTQALTIFDMTEGDSCTYKIRGSTCAPAIRLSDDSTIGHTQIDISYVEFDSAKTE